jgi:hypothetical protein
MENMRAGEVPDRVAEVSERAELQPSVHSLLSVRQAAKEVKKFCVRYSDENMS